MANKKKDIGKNNKKTEKIKKQSLLEKIKKFKNNKNSSAIIGLVCSMVGIFTFGITSIIGIIISSIELKKKINDEKYGRDFAKAGLVIGLFELSAVILLALVSFMIISVPTKTTSKEEQIEKVGKNYSVGDIIKVKKQTGEYDVVITKIEKIKSDTENAVKITYEYTNKNIEYGVYISNYNFEAIGNEDAKLDFYHIDHKYPEYAYPKETKTAELIYNITSEEQIKLEFYNNTFDKKPTAYIKLNIE